MGIWRKLSRQEQSDRGIVVKEWPRKVFGLLWAGGRCAAEGLLGPELLASGQLKPSLWGEGPELRGKQRAALTTSML